MMGGGCLNALNRSILMNGTHQVPNNWLGIKGHHVRDERRSQAYMFQGNEGGRLSSCGIECKI